MADETNPRRPAHFAAHCEIQDAGRLPFDVSAAPAAATIELAKILTVFDTQIDDEWRAQLIALGGGLFRLANAIDAGDVQC